LVARTFVTGMIGAYFLSAGIQGYLIFRIHVIERVLLFAAGLLLIHPGAFTDVVGGILGATIFLPRWYRWRALKISPTADLIHSPKVKNQYHAH